MALAGFTGSEVGNKYPKDPEVLREALELRGMEICNQWFSSFLITKPFEEVEKEFRAQLAFLKAMGAKIIGASEQSHSVQGMQDTPIFGHKYVMNDEEWETFCTGMNGLGKIAKEEYGISLTFHHHMGTVVQNPDEVERMMENTDPEYVSLLFDTGHFTYCGADPLEMPPACTAYIINAPLIENCGNCEDTEQLQIAVTIYAAKNTAAEQDL